MSESRKTFDRNYNDLLFYASVYLPEGWSIELTVVKGEASMALRRGGEDVDFHPIDGDVVDLWVDLVNRARSDEGLDEATWEEYWAKEGGG